MNEVCNVTNKSCGLVIYKVPELNVRREFQPQETKKNIPVNELEQLASQPGGRTLIYNYLYLSDPEVLNEVVNQEVAPEYWLKEEDIPNWMKTCTLDEFKDAIEFGPLGTIDLIKRYSVSLPLNDAAKRAALKEQLNYDVDTILKNIAPDDGEVVASEKKTTGRRTTSSIAVPAAAPESETPAEKNVEAPEEKPIVKLENKE